MNIQDEIMLDIMNVGFCLPQQIPTFIQEIQLFEEFLEANVKQLDDDTLAALELQIKRNSIGYILDGLAFGFIKQTRLYRRHTAKWKDYCQSRFNKSVGYCNQLIKTAQTVLKLVRAGFKKLPANEAQARPLTKIEDESVCDKWQEVLDVTATDYGGVLTASTVSRIVGDEAEPATKNVKISKAAYDKLKELSRETGKSIDEVIQNLLGFDTGAGVPDLGAGGSEPEQLDSEQLQQWEQEFLDEHGVRPAPAPTSIDTIRRWQSEWKLVPSLRDWIREQAGRLGLAIDDMAGPMIPETS